MTTITRQFVMEKATKNTIKYNEEPPKGEPPICGTLYLQKWAAGEAREITVTVEIPS